jgi:hypothetical protein
VVGIAYLVNRIGEQEAETQKARDQNQTEEIYEAQFRAYELALISFGDCLALVRGRDDHRHQWTEFYEELRAELQSETATNLVNRLIAQLDENLPALDPKDFCEEPGPPPRVPAGTDVQETDVEVPQYPND